MIAQKYRFHGHGSLRYLYRHGDAVRTRTLTLRFIKNPRRKNARFAVIVAKKVLKKAVKRNIMRRRIYEVIRELHPRIKASQDIALTVFSAELLEASHEELRQQIIEVLTRADVLESPRAE
jgi:ribonuclease P protein component